MYIVAGSNGTSKMVDFCIQSPRVGIEGQNLNYGRGQTALFVKVYEHIHCRQNGAQDAVLNSIFCLWQLEQVG